MKLYNNKKGNWFDILDYGKGSLVLAISIIIAYVMISMLNNQIIISAGNNSMINDSDALSAMQGSVDVFPVTDYILPLIYLVFIGFSAWSARKIESSHKFLFLSFIMMIVIVFFAMFIETMWQAFYETAIITSYMSSFPITNFMMSNLRYFVILYGIIVGSALYAKKE